MQMLTILFEAIGYLMGVLTAFALIAVVSGVVIAWVVKHDKTKSKNTERW